MAFRAYLLVFLLALVSRGGWWAYQEIGKSDESKISLPDEQQYLVMARSWWATGEFRDELGFRAGRMPLYPMFVALLAGPQLALAQIFVAQCVIGALGAGLACSLGTALLGPRAGRMAGVIVACDPYLIHFSTLLLTETLFVTALLLVWRLGLRGMAITGKGAPVQGSTGPGADERGSPRYTKVPWVDSLILGAVCALAIYIRESGIMFAVGLLVFRLWAGRASGTRWLETGISAAVIGLMLLPWAAYNHVRLGEWVFLTTRTGITLFDGVGPQADGTSDLGDIKACSEVQSYIDQGDEVGWDRYFRDAAMQSAINDPVRILKLVPEKLRRTWNIVPNADEGRSAGIMLVSAAWTVGVYLLVVIGIYGAFRSGSMKTEGEAERRIVKGDRKARAVGYLLVPAIVVTVLHAVFVGSIRYRLPAMPMLEVLGSLGVVFIMDRVRAALRGRESYA